jgi:hypothetical protein
MTERLSQTELDEIFKKSQQDGSKLYSTVDSLHKFSQIIIGLIGLIGVIAGFGVMSNANFLAGLVVIFLTIALCIFMYMIQIVLSNSSKVLVHILFCNLAILKKESK